MRIGLITTLDTNIGDDFIREGICLVLRETFKTKSIEFVPVNKHQPMTVYPKGHPCRLAESIPYAKRYIYFLFGTIFSKKRLTLFDECDLIVQCGAPVLWPGCHMAEWAVPLWYQVVGRLHSRIPVLNLAAGSCYPWEKQPIVISDSKDTEYLKAILAYCRLTTSRDTLAQSLFSSLGEQTPHIPCTGFLAAKNFEKHKENGNLVLINYMEGGGHYDWGQGIDITKWKNIIQQFIDRMRRRHRIAFLCHNQKEYELARHLDSSIDRFFPKTSNEYFQMISRASVAMCNRMHASVGLAGLGIPSVAVGTDTRLLMVKSLNLPNYYVKDVSVELLENEIENLLKNRSEQKDRLRSLQSDTFKVYLDIISKNCF